MCTVILTGTNSNWSICFRPLLKKKKTTREQNRRPVYTPVQEPCFSRSSSMQWSVTLLHCLSPSNSRSSSPSILTEIYMYQEFFSIPLSVPWYIHVRTTPGRNPLSQNYRLVFPKFSYIKWNSIFHFNSEIPVALAFHFGHSSREALVQMLGQMERQISDRTCPTRTVVLLEIWTPFSETFPVGPNRSILFRSDIFGNFGLTDRAPCFFLLTYWNNQSVVTLFFFLHLFDVSPKGWSILYDSIYSQMQWFFTQSPFQRARSLFRPHVAIGNWHALGTRSFVIPFKAFKPTVSLLFRSLLLLCHRPSGYVKWSASSRTELLVIQFQHFHPLPFFIHVSFLNTYS